MLDKLFEFLSQWISDLLPVVIVPSYEEGVLLRFGKFKKGKISLQDHGDVVHFRNLMIKKL